MNGPHAQIASYLHRHILFSTETYPIATAITVRRRTMRVLKQKLYASFSVSSSRAPEILCNLDGARIAGFK
jgi:hypothetical protein